ncbi:MAG: hypothetical protein GF331_06125 [Chitinivibrionales bacterium]|nr:hypothetical protein [Chitinivibrionales bacterium]
MTQAKCTTASYEPGYDCYNHLRVTPVPAPWRYHLTAPLLGYGVRMDKTNLDSIQQAPSDSIFQADGHRTHFDSIPPDSLQQAIGNSYVIKSGTDPRCDCIYFAKFRILDIIIIDSANHEVDMVFLWACNVNSRRDLPTIDLDTFGLDPVAVKETRSYTKSGGRGRVPLVSRVIGPGRGLRVVRERGVGGRVEVFDLRGRITARRFCFPCNGRERKEARRE